MIYVFSLRYIILGMNYLPNWIIFCFIIFVFIQIKMVSNLRDLIINNNTIIGY